MHRIGRLGPLSSLVALGLVLAGCGGGGAAATVPAGKDPQRIVSLSPTATEDLFAIGAGSQVVAVDDQSNFPPRAPQTKLSGFQPSVEAIASYRPDLVVVAGEGTAAAVRGLAKLGVPTLVEPAAESLSQAYTQIRRLGGSTGHATAARAVVARIRAGIARAVAGAPSGTGLTVFHELSPDYFSADSRTFIGGIYRLFGLANVADRAGASAGSGYPQLSGEHIVAASPDLVVLADTKCCRQSPATVRARPGWGSVAALHDGGVIGVDDDIASRWGPRIARFAARVAAAIRAVREARGE